jgi:ATP-binding cassette subfamily B protein
MGLSGKVNAKTSAASIKPTSKPDAKLLARCYRYLAPYWRFTAGAYATVVVINLLNSLLPQFIRWIIDRAIGSQATSGSTATFFAISIAALLGISILRSILSFYQGQWSEIASQNVAYDLRNELQRKLTQLSFAFHDQSRTGELLSRTVQDVERIRFLTGRATLRIMEAMLLILITAIILVSMNLQLAVMSLLIIPLLVWRAYTFGRYFRPLSLQIQKQLATLTTLVEQSLRGARTVKAFAQEALVIRQFEEENEAWFQLSATATRVQEFNIPLLNLIANLGTVAVIWLGGMLVIQGELSLGELVAFSAYLGQLVNPIRRMGQVIPVLSIAGSAAERVFEVLDFQSKVQDDPQATPLVDLKGKIEFRNVGFAYGKYQVLQGINLTAEPGQVIALVGPTGSGKSSLVNLIPRFYDPTSGSILIDSVDLRKATLYSLRSQIGIVLQETTLFAATIRENIAFGRPDATDEDVIAAAQAAQADEFINRLPEGYATRVGERGVTLSGGQKQRLAIARALLIDPRILILDDAMSSVDSETEHLIRQALERLLSSRTAFVIAHRLSTLQMADKVVVLQGGRIIDQGTHRSLLESSAVYAEICQRQLRSMEQTGATEATG